MLQLSFWHSFWQQDKFVDFFGVFFGLDICKNYVYAFGLWYKSMKNKRTENHNSLFVM